MNRTLPTSRPQELGGIAILVVLVLLSIMTVAAVSVGSTSLREISITGNESVGRKAAEAADAGMDWTIAWSNPDATGASTGVAETSIQNAMRELKEAIGSQDAGTITVSSDPLPSDAAGNDYTDYGILNKTTGNLRLFLRSGDKLYKDTSLFLSKKGSNASFLQDSVVEPAFDLEVRYLGPSMTLTASGTKTKNQGGLFLIRTLGRANIGSTGQSFIAQREVLVDHTPQ